MPPPIKVELLPHDPHWVVQARAYIESLAAALSPTLLTVHHIGSTAIPGIRAKPVIDLIPVVIDLAALDHSRPAVEQLGYEWWGEYGLPGRRYCTLADRATGKRIAQLHCYADGSPEITRHLAFRDYLLQHPEIASAYDCEKARCQALHPNDSHAYSDCKGEWIRKVEAEATQGA